MGGRICPWVGEGDDYPEDSTPNKPKEKYIVNVSYRLVGLWILGRAVDSGQRPELTNDHTVCSKNCTANFSNGGRLQLALFDASAGFECV